jgi:hypothetical protein
MLRSAFGIRKGIKNPSSDDVLVLELTVIYLKSFVLVISTQQFTSSSVKTRNPASSDCNFLQNTLSNVSISKTENDQNCSRFIIIEYIAPLMKGELPVRT